MQRKVYMLPGRLAFGQLDGTGYGTPMEPAIGIDSQCLACKVPEMGMLLDALQKREQSWKAGQYIRECESSLY